MTKKTIIHIDSGDYTTFKEWEPKHYGNWATPFSEQTMKFSKDYKIEIWMDYVTDYYGDNGISVRRRNGITFKQFPAVSFTQRRIFSFEMLKHLRQRIISGEKILVHFQNLHRFEINLIALFCKGIPLIAQQRSPSHPPMWNFRFDFHPARLFQYLLDIVAIKNFDFIFCPSVGEYNYLTKNYGLSNVLRIKGGGIDFNIFKPRNKFNSKKKLSLDSNIFYIIHIGRINDTKGLDVALVAIRKLMEKRQDIRFIYIGDLSTKTSYDKKILNLLKNSNSIITGEISRDKVLDYLSASEVYLLPSRKKKWVPFGDFDVSAIEASRFFRPQRAREDGCRTGGQ